LIRYCGGSIRTLGFACQDNIDRNTFGVVLMFVAGHELRLLLIVILHLLEEDGLWITERKGESPLISPVFDNKNILTSELMVAS